MKTWIKITTLLFTTIACVHGEYKKSVMVSYETAEGWSKNALVEVTFATGSELSKQDIPGVDGTGNYGMIWFKGEEMALIELEVPRGIILGATSFDHADFLCMFIPSGAVSGKQANGKGTNYRFEAPWPGSEDLQRVALRVEREAITSDDRLTAAEMKMVQDDRAGAFRHLRIAKRDFLRSDNRMKAGQIDILISVAE
jgi:hypothetical protein